MINTLSAGGIFTAIGRDKRGNVLWEENFHNLITTEGLNHSNDVLFAGATQTAAWYIGAKGTGTAVLADTMASHAGWSEVTAYDEAVRQTFVETASSGGVTSNTGNLALITASSAITVAGLFLCSLATKGGTTGILLVAGDFSSSKTLATGETLTMGYTYTLANA